MHIAAQILITLVAILHLYFMYFEMFAWESIGARTFRGFPKAYFRKTKSMAANQGLYNGFLAAGLIWTFFIENAVWKSNIALFFLGCVVLAGCYGAYSVSKKIFYIQAFPALFAVVLLLLAR